jgi:spore germination cell wall hydrolase CwlJ-like protein
MKIFIIVLVSCVMMFSADASRASTGVVECLAGAAYKEARGESKIGQIAVMWVILNRVNSLQFPDSVCGVLYQKGQFPWARQKSKLTSDEEHVILAREVLEGNHPDPTNGALYFQSVKNFNNKKVKAKIGNHYFFE